MDTKKREDVGLSMERPFRMCRMVWSPDVPYSHVPAGDNPDAGEQQGIYVGIPPNTERHYIPEHNHEFYEITLVLEGSATHIHGEQAVTLRPGDVLVMGPGFVHAFADIRRLTKVNIYLQPQWLAEDLRVLWTEAGLIRFLLADALFGNDMSESFLHLHTTPAEMRRWSNEIDEVMSEAQSPRPSLALFNACFLKVLNILDAAYLRQGYGEGLPFRPEIWEAVRAIEHRVASGRPFSTTEVAQSVGMSRRPFSELFRDATGMLPSDYYQRRRVQHALPLLSDASMSVTDVAFALGFSDAAYFTRTFKKVQGVSPNTYRKRHGISANGA